VFKEQAQEPLFSWTLNNLAVIIYILKWLWYQMLTCGLINGVICGIKSDASCRHAQRRFRNALLFVAVDKNREDAARAVRQPRATRSLPVESTEPGEPLDLDDLALTAGDRASSGLRQSQRKR
jgi:hypothetical protein